MKQQYQGTPDRWTLPDVGRALAWCSERNRQNIACTLHVLDEYTQSREEVDAVTAACRETIAGISGNARVNGIGPGPVRTQINKELWVDPKKREEYEARLPLRRFAEAGEIAGVALLLASNASGYMTGQTIYCDGGVLL